jgi:transposase
MVIIGIDAHKRSHTAVAVDGTGRKLAERTVSASRAGHLELLRWAHRWRVRRWAIEDCRHLTHRLEADLLAAAQDVVRVHPKLMAGARRTAREPGKSDPLDALSVARATLREPDLPVARLDGIERELRLLVDHREDLVADRTGHQERLRWFLVELGIEEPPARALDRRVVLDRLEAELARRFEPVARFARDLLGRIRELTAAIDALEREIRSLAEQVAPSLLALAGCGPLTAAKLVGQTGGIDRFRSRAAFARHNGTAPVPVWSGNDVRHRLNRGGDRQLNVALHRIAVTQLQREGPGRTYVAKRMAAGNTKTEAIRALRRHLSNVVFERLQLDQRVRLESPAALTAAAA